jgi:hypothetical protein
VGPIQPEQAGLDSQEKDKQADEIENEEELDPARMLLNGIPWHR